MAATSLLAAPPNQPVNVQIMFTEYQARVFNQTEAAYKSNGYLSTPLFEDSYLLSKANGILENVPLTGTNSSVNTQATTTYRGVLGIAAPPPPPPPPPPGPRV